MITKTILNLPPPCFAPPRAVRTDCILPHFVRYFGYAYDEACHGSVYRKEATMITKQI